jgi:anaerobic magnesium-protoporphyrin IX monomethyl ester cyclase
MRTIPPVGIATMSALLKENNFTVEVFDCTRYQSTYINPERDYDSSHEKYNRMDIHKDRVKNSNVRPFDWSTKEITLKTTDIYQDFRTKVDEFGPDLIALSVVENTFDLCMNLIGCIETKCPVVLGGVFPTYAPEICIRLEKVSFVCRGEGEFPMLDLCNRLRGGRDVRGVENIWVKESSGNVHRNPLRLPVNILDLPKPDYSIFEAELFYTPMQGEVRKVVGVETQRGCPYTCSYCNSPSNNVIYKSDTGRVFYRKKSIKQLRDELDFYVKTMQPELIYFVADTFLAMSSKELEEFSEMYQDYKIPFWMNTRAETITEHSAEHLAKMNCLRFNIGIEHGNEKYRKEVLKRAVKNDAMVRSFEIAATYSDEYTCVANSIVGLPKETPDLVFDTIELNRRLPDEIVAAGAFVFAPYWGTPLRDMAIKEGYIDDQLICLESSNTSGGSLLNMPEFSREQIDGFMRTFSFYVKFERERWPQIDRARLDDPIGNKMFDELRTDYSSTYLESEPIKNTWTESRPKRQEQRFD